MNCLLTTVLMLWLGAAPAILDGATIKEAVRRFVVASLKDSGEEAQIEFRSIPDTLVVSSAGCTVTVDEASAGRLRGPLSMMVNVVSAKRVERRLPVSVTVRRFGTVVVAARPLERHAVLTAADVRLERMETTMLQSGYCIAPDALTGKRLKRMFAEGSVLYSGMCELVPLIHQGDLVTLIVRAGSVVLSARATAKQDGSKGELINVQREGTHDRIKASVLDRGIVEALID